MLSLNGAGPLSTRLSIEDVRRAQAEAAAVELPDAVLAALVRLWKRLRERGITVSDRRFRNGIRYLKAHAWLEGRARVAEDDLEILADLLWQEPEQALEVRKLVLELANPLVAKAEELYDKAVERYQRLQNMDENAKDEADHKKVMETASETLGQLRRIGRSLQALISQAEKEGCNPARIGQWLADVERMFQEISRVYMMGGL
jgi:MoxR-like ATPase